MKILNSMIWGKWLRALGLVVDFLDAGAFLEPTTTALTSLLRIFLIYFSYSGFQDNTINCHDIKKASHLQSFFYFT